MRLKEEKVRPSNLSVHLSQESHLLNKSISHQISSPVGSLPENNQDHKINLKDIFFKHRVNQIVKEFASKARRNSVFAHSGQSYLQEEEQKLNIFYKYYFNWIKKASRIEGFQIRITGLIFFHIISLLQLILLAFMLSITITFPETHLIQSFVYIRMFGFMFYVISTIINMTTKSYLDGKTLHSVGQICSNYIKRDFTLDIISTLLLPLDFATFYQESLDVLLLFLVILKLAKTFRKLSKFKHIIIETSQEEHFYGLIKVFFTNIFIAHFVSIFLNLMADFDIENNWQIKIQIQNQSWSVKYIWGYYWGTNIMLTVGFGDISATNYYQAVSLIFVQILSCIIISYNICEVGALITSLRQKQKQKEQKLKQFHRICKQNLISDQVQLKISNFVEYKHRANELYQFNQQETIKDLPAPIRREFNKQKQNCNSKLLQNLNFFTLFSNKTLKQIAAQLQRKIYNPQQIILSSETPGCNLYILKRGKVGFICTINSVLQGKQMQQIGVEKGDKPKIVSFNFVQNKAPNYNLKSSGTSVVYSIARDQLMDCLKQNNSSYQMFFFLRDSLRQRYGHKCQLCGILNHTKFDCGRLHFNPSKHQVIVRSFKADIQKTNRRPIERQKAVNVSLKNVFKTKIHKKQKLIRQQQIYGMHQESQQLNLPSMQEVQLECDQMCNFKSYFNQDNLQKVIQRHNTVQRNKKKHLMWQ